MFRKILGVSLLLGGLSWARPAVADSPWPAAERAAQVDAQGVLRWRDTGEEVALFGVNYYTPFWHNYPDLKELGAAHKQVIDQDVLHFARMGLDALRLHVFDREVTRILWREWPMEIRLDDLSNGFSVRALNTGNDLRTSVQAARFTIRPGVYLLQRQGVVTDQRWTFTQESKCDDSRTPSARKRTGTAGASRSCLRKRRP